MDCEKFETTLIDELYDELDELTSAAAKRHIAGCARCAALLSGLRATRRVAVLPLEEPSSDFETRILAATKEAQKVIPFRARLARGVSRAGSWAMRPQTAMAAVFLLMIGSSVLLLRGGKQRAPASMTVTEEGAPAPQNAAASAEVAQSGDLTAAATAAHGPLDKTEVREGHRAIAEGERPREVEAKKIHGSAVTEDEEQSPALAYGKGGGATNAGVPGGVENRLPPAATAAPADQLDDRDRKEKDASPFAGAMASYKAGRYDEAAQAFGGLGRAGDVNAAYWAARSVRAGSGKCGQAAPMFDRVAASAGGSSLGNQALLDAGQCYRIIGRYDDARSRLTRLLAVSDFEARARAELQAMPGPAVAAARAAPKAPAGKAAEAPAAPAPAAPSRPATQPAKGDLGL